MLWEPMAIGHPIAPKAQATGGITISAGYVKFDGKWAEWNIS